MFTGLVEEVAIVKAIEHRQHSAHIHIRAVRVLEGITLGDSISVNGACLTVVHFSQHEFTADAVPETMRRTTLSRLRQGDVVNVERALRVGDRLGGHIVSGHVDGVGVIRQREAEGIANVLTIEAPTDVMRYVVDKGSICVNGVSLTVMDTAVCSFRLSVIPHTGEHTALLRAKVGDVVNLECDVIAKYVEKLLLPRDDGMATGQPTAGQSQLDMDYLRQNGFA